MDGGKLKVKDANLLLQVLVAAIIVDNDLRDIPFDKFGVLPNPNTFEVAKWYIQKTKNTIKNS